MFYEKIFYNYYKDKRLKFGKMAFYKKKCVNCAHLVNIDVKICPSCSLWRPVEFLCPYCGEKTDKKDTVCRNCNESIIGDCPYCGQTTALHYECEQCGEKFLKKCKNRKCCIVQHIYNKICASCGYIM